MLRLLAEANLPKPVPQYTVRVDGRVFRLDGAIPEYKVGVEHEGFDYHISRTAFDLRYERDRLLKNAGWWIVYVTSRTTPERLVADVRYALERRGYPSLPILPSM